MARLLQANITKLGSFKLPQGSGLDYGGYGLTLGPTGKTLFIQAWAGEHGSAEFSIPSIGGTASVVQPATASLEGKIALIGDDQGNGRNIGGHLAYGGKLLINTFLYYDAA